MTTPVTMRARVEDYLAMRRSLGYQLRGDGRMLLAFADRLDQAGQATVTVSQALAWAMEPKNASITHWGRRLAVVRLFARHLHTLDPTCEIPRPACCPLAHIGRRRISIPIRRSLRSSTRPARLRRRCTRPPVTQ